ncbi:type II secretion system F family protein [Gudongella sp. DL1XJH-153]|uniref:type II secretion system F family protein n=1 Tax=Gudongella sp. DL1XJH-153 TaxID=3409804 RepID=UPI003BB72B63
MIYLILFLGFLTVFLVFLGLYAILFNRKLKVANRMEMYLSDEEEVGEEEDISFKEFVLKTIGTVSRSVSRKSYMEEKKAKLQHAYIFMRVEEFLGLSLLVATGLGLLLFLLTRMWFIGVAGFLLGFRIPDMVVTSTKKKRMKQLNSQLPEALTILSNGLRAGFSFIQAMNVAATEMESPIRDEFLRIMRDNSIGKTLDDALMDFSNRTDDEDVDMFVTALIIQRKVGGNLAEILDTIAATIRDRMRIRGEIRTLTAQSRISAVIISLLPFAIALITFVVNREYIMELFGSTVGVIMVVLAIFFQIVGAFIMMRLADIEI